MAANNDAEHTANSGLAKADRYALRGVSSGKEDVHAAIKTVDKGLYPAAFCKIIPDFFSNDESQCLIMHADGAGTKSSLAYAYYKHLKDTLTESEFKIACDRIWKNIAQDSLVMNLDDLICVGATESPILFSSTINRNKNIVPGEVLSSLIQGSQSVISDLQELGINVIATGGETADMPDLVRTIVVDSTLTVKMPRKDVISLDKVSVNDVIVALASDGQATYETEWNSGMGSNGLSSARHDIFSKAFLKKYPECSDPTLDASVAFTGKHNLADEVEITDESGKKFKVNVAEMVLSPTRTYAPIIKQVLKEVGGGEDSKIHGIVHCSGGGQTKILHFLPKEKPVRVIKDNMFPVPALFKIIQRDSGTDWKEMYKVFNMGHRMELYCDPQAAAKIIEISESFNVKAQIVGKVEMREQSQPRLEIRAEKGTFIYE